MTTDTKHRPQTAAEWADFATNATGREMHRALNTCNNPDCEIYDDFVSKNPAGYCTECHKAATLSEATND